MDDLLSRLDAEALIPIIIAPVFFLFLSICIVAYQWRAHYRSETEASLKQEMLERGMSADEIEKVVNATGHSKK